MKKLIIILLLSPYLGLSQAPLNAAYKDTIFLDVNWSITKDRTKAIYYRQITPKSEDSLLLVRDYYIDSDILQMVGTYAREMKQANQYGHFIYYYPNGNRKATYDYQWGLIHGELRRYYTSGILKSIEQFDLGTKVDTSRSFYPNGQLRIIEVQNLDFSSDNPSDRYKKTRLISAFGIDGDVQVFNGKGQLKEYYLSGKLKTQINYVNGFPHGTWIKYAGQKKKKNCVMTFKNGTFIKGEIYENGKKDIFSSLQRSAYFPTGKRGLEKFIYENIGNCTDGFENEVIILVNVSTQGKVRLEQVLSGNVNACQLEEIQNLVDNMPLWVPAVNIGQYAEGSQSIKINFSK